MTLPKTCDTGRSAATLGGIALGGLLGTTILCGAVPASAAGDGDMLDLSGLQRVADSSLGDLRGGFRLGNLDITFGVQITTSVNGQEILQTSLNMINPGQFTQTTTTLGGAAGVAAQAAAEAAGGGGGMTGFQPASAAPIPSEGATATDSSGAGTGWTFNQTDSGVQAVSADLATTIMHEITSSVTTNITNTADNQTIANDTQLDLFLNNFEAVQMQSVTNQVMSGMMTEMMNAGALSY